jgi:hypothetical protein
MVVWGKSGIVPFALLMLCVLVLAAATTTSFVVYQILSVTTSTGVSEADEAGGAITRPIVVQTETISAAKGIAETYAAASVSQVQVTSAGGHVAQGAGKISFGDTFTKESATTRAQDVLPPIIAHTPILRRIKDGM